MTPGNTRCLANCTGGPSSCFKAQLEAVHYQQPPWSTRFPELVDIFAEGDPCVPVDNDISDNTYCHQGSLNNTGPLGFTNVDADTVRSWMSTMSNVSTIWPVHCRRLKQRGVCRTAGAAQSRPTTMRRCPLGCIGICTMRSRQRVSRNPSIGDSSSTARW